MNPDLASAVHDLLHAAAGSVVVTSGYRSYQQQQQLWQQALAQYGSPEAADDWVARPGTSMHERGLAVDLDGDLSLATRLVAKLGLPMYRPLANEDWHFELVGSRPRRDPRLAHL
jgi:LAS superfamily LD-carboxypeptidase LdcB